ncbi:uncharacterized protein LOC6034768 [Culex quinquefasciatus]|uniref:uncharacterized protein LOC6034768 n=1 Tax=Culex quinquefasciatus TaxID=7176 RepID=UPI0018E3D874|nr:uncharacterized protein LOC6034768 [Culex quinquefasciatus]
MAVGKFKICLRHFKVQDRCKVTSTYLKSNAIPSRQIKRLPKRQKTSQVTTKPPLSHLWDHNYCLFYKPKSKTNNICYVSGCYSRVKNGTRLHRFPAKGTKRFKLWLNLLKCRLMPTKNSKICSNHFKQTDYLPGGRYLKKTRYLYLFPLV